MPAVVNGRGGVFGTTARDRQFQQARACFNSTSVCVAELVPGLAELYYVHTVVTAYMNMTHYCLATAARCQQGLFREVSS